MTSAIPSPERLRRLYWAAQPTLGDWLLAALAPAGLIAVLHGLAFVMQNIVGHMLPPTLSALFMLGVALVKYVILPYRAHQRVLQGDDLAFGALLAVLALDLLLISFGLIPVRMM